MGQHDILDFLKLHRNRWFSCREISEYLCTGLGSTGASLKKLRRSGEVYFNKSHNSEGKEILVYKIKIED